MIVSTTHIAPDADLLVQARHLMAELERARREHGTQAALQAQTERHVDELRARVRAESAEAMRMLRATGLPCPWSET